MPTIIIPGLLLAALGVLLTKIRAAERIATVLTGIAFAGSLIVLWSGPASSDALGFSAPGALLLAAVICFISLIVQAYSLRHLDGYRRRRRTFQMFVGLTLALLVFTGTDHLLLMVLGLGLGNYFLARLIAQETNWEASRASGRMAWRHLGLGALLLLIGVMIFFFSQGNFSLEALGDYDAQSTTGAIVGGLVLAAALLQSAIWPVHRWLIASANAPTPVSAFMHAGLINGGALLIYKFAPLLMQLRWGLTLLVVLGAVTALLGTTWMLVQSDLKRTLTCSTMGQMGFMILQCGLGLFPAAIAHMIWHGFFKASLFLSAGSAVNAAPNYSLRLSGRQALPTFGIGLLTGIGGAWLFWLFTGSTGGLDTTYLLLLVFCGVTCAHAVMAILLPRFSAFRIFLASGLGLFGASVYGLSVWLVETQLFPFIPRPLSALHLIILSLFLIGWLSMIFRAYLPESLQNRLLAPLYLRVLRASQPARLTLTLRRSQYSQ